jgi:hypothetical protein
MDNLSTTTITDITSMIGALEVGDNLGGYSDRVLEAAGEFAGPPTPRTGTCTHMCTVHCISDSALEAAGATIGPAPPTHVTVGCPTLICR